MHEHKLANAIERLTDELQATRAERGKGLVTKQDLREAEARIIATFRGVSLPEAEKFLQSLRASNDEVEKAVAAHSQQQ